MKLLDVDALTIEIADKQLFKPLSFKLSSGELWHLKGANGAGKTTLFKTLLGLYPLESGDIQRHCSLGYIGHKLAIDNLLTAEENLRFLTLNEATEAQCSKALSNLNLSKYRTRLASQLSEGQRKCLSLARFFALKRKVWLLDEPFSALDLAHQQQFQQALLSYVKKGGCVLMTSHSDYHFNDIAFRELSL